MGSCKECGAEVSSKAKACPGCGADPRSWWGRRNIITKAIIAWFGLMTAVGFFGAMFSSSPEATPDSTAGQIVEIYVSFHEDQGYEKMYELMFTDLKNNMSVDEFRRKIKLNDASLDNALVIATFNKVLSETIDGDQATVEFEYEISRGFQSPIPRVGTITLLKEEEGWKLTEVDRYL